MASKDIQASLERLSAVWASINRTPTPPRSTMDVIEYGLGEHRRAEVYLNRLLRYLLDPTATHGMQADFLTAFLDALPAEIGFDEELLDPTDVRVREQVPVWQTTDGDESPGYLDLLLDVPGEWFLLIELKFGAPQTGTKAYCSAVRLGDDRVDAYESGHYYLYLHHPDRSGAHGDCFADWTWRSFVEDCLTPFIAADVSRYPQRTTSQLHDLRYDIEQVANMTQDEPDTDRNVALYLEHADAVDDVRQSFDERWDAHKRTWGDRVVDAIKDHETVQSAQPSSDDEHARIFLDRTDRDGEPEQWILRAGASDWQHVLKWGWFRHEETDEYLPDRHEDLDDLRIGFYLRMGQERYRRELVHERQIAFSFRCMGSNPTSFIDKFRDNFADERGTIERLTTNRARMGWKQTDEVHGAISHRRL